MGGSKKQKPGLDAPYRKVLTGSFEEVDMVEAVESVRRAFSRGEATEKDLCYVLLCTNDTELHEEALCLARKNIDDWGRLWLFRMYYNGVGTERDIKTALRTLYYDDSVMSATGGAQYKYIVNKDIFVYGDIVLCGTRKEVLSLFCVCAGYGVRPDYYVCPGEELPEMYGKPCPDDGESRCYIRFSTNGDIETGPGAVFVYHPFGEEAAGEDSLLLPRTFSPDKGAAIAPRGIVALNRAPKDAIVDVRILNEAGYCIGRKSSGDFESCSLETLEPWYRIGKGIYDRMKERGGRYLVASYYPMGDNYRWISRFEGVDYSDVTFAVTESARDHPVLQGVKGMLLSRGEIGCIRIYLSMMYHEDPMVRMVPYQPLYPGTTFHGNLDTHFTVGEARRLKDPGLNAMGTIPDVGRARKRAAPVIPRTVLLNPYGNSIAIRPEDESKKGYDAMVALSRRFLKRGYLVFTNTPFPDQKELPGTMRYEGDIVTTVAQATSFDLIVTVFTGFMETVMYSKANLVVLSYARENSRKRMARSLGRDNYWELNLLENKTSVLASKVTRIMDELPIDKPKRFYRNNERAMTIQEKAALFSKDEITLELVRAILYSAGKKDIKGLVDEGTKDPLLCCVGAMAMDHGIQVPVDKRRAILWYRRAGKQGVTLFMSRVSVLKGELKASMEAGFDPEQP
ncbi:MAG: SEL1-like repeat protein [Thermoplasmata archaeon]|jgi:TPR repeat protein|nr:SEL1-like repeat protein [Thermoplasmata archaeon]